MLSDRYYKEQLSFLVLVYLQSFLLFLDVYIYEGTVFIYLLSFLPFLSLFIHQGTVSWLIHLPKNSFLACSFTKEWFLGLFIYQEQFSFTYCHFYPFIPNSFTKEQSFGLFIHQGMVSWLIHLPELIYLLSFYPVLAYSFTKEQFITLFTYQGTVIIYLLSFLSFLGLFINQGSPYLLTVILTLS